MINKKVAQTGRWKKLRHYFLVLIIVSLFAGCQNSPEQQQLVIFHAGSLSVPVKRITEAYQQAHPDVRFMTEAAGSVASIRKITDLHRDCDILLSADYSIIDKMMIPEYSSWNIRFAANEMVIAYTNDAADSIDANNWQRVLANDKVRFGRSDPDSDPCGYRTVLVLDLAERILGLPELRQNLLDKDRRYMRPKETDLIALLETHTVDYIFIYRSVAVQHKLGYLLLPDSINLKSPLLADWYGTASVEIVGSAPGTKITQHGEPMIYGLTMPHNAPNPELAIDFLHFFLDATHGMRLMEEAGQPSVVPAPASGYDEIPTELQKYALPPG
ncbi:MAG: tungstate ABC transporter substrate-binding protein WtpA [Clostridia bacterium]|nr:tungstate ABC transporter substrate-binding protein WtpA [Clostridia bacterium]